MQADKLLLIFAVVFLLRVDTAFAEGVYLGVHGGVNVAVDGDLGVERDVRYDSGLAFGITAGYKWPFDLRTEVEMTLRGNGVRSSSFDGTGVIAGVLMVNAFYDVDTGTNWIPYLGVGFGRIAGGTLNRSINGTTAFAIQFGAGLGHAITDSFIVSLDYRFLAARDSGVGEYSGEPTNFEFTFNTVLLALRFEF